MRIDVNKMLIFANYFGTSVEALYNCDYVQLARDCPQVNCSGSLSRKIRERQALIDAEGQGGEDFVFSRELAKLAGTSFEGAVTTGFSEDPCAHFDLLSFDAETKEPICIEVKTTTGGMDEPFYMSRAEYDFLLECYKTGQRYELHRVLYWGTARQKVGILSAEQVLRKYYKQSDGFWMKKRKGA